MAACGAGPVTGNPYSSTLPRKLAARYPHRLCTFRRRLQLGEARARGSPARRLLGGSPASTSSRSTWASPTTSCGRRCRCLVTWR